MTSSSSTSFTSPGEHAGLNGGADGHDFVRVHAAVRLLAEEVLHHGLHGRHAGLAADDDDLVDLAGRSPASSSACCTGPLRAFDELVHKLLELGARQSS